MSRRRRKRHEKRRRHERGEIASKRRLAAGAGLTIGATLAAAGSAEATTFTVTNTADTGAGSLRAALNANDANNNQPTVDTIVFASGLSGTINAGLVANRGLYTFEPVDIQGPGADVLTINEAAGAFTYVFHTNQANDTDPVTISGLTLTGGDPDGTNPLSVEGGGGISSYGADLTVRNSVVTNNYAYDEGGGIRSSANLTIESSEVSGNSTDDDGGGIFVGNQGGLSVDASQITSNFAGSGEDGGGIQTLTQAATINSSNLSGNYSYLSGGGIQAYGPVTIQGSTLSGNYTYFSGAGAYSRDDPITIQDSTLSGNRTGSFVGGGAVATLYGGVTVRSSTLSGNDTAVGGAVYVYKPYYPSTIQNSTMQGNDAYYGGGVFLNQPNGQPFTIVGSTIAGNGFETGVFGSGGGIHVLNPGSPNLALQNTIVSGNKAQNGTDLNGTFDAAFSLIQNPAGATINETVAGSNLLGVNPQLGPLANNGGPTQTMALSASSPAVDKGSSSAGTYQRGSPRPFDFAAIPNSAAAGADGADMGAFELGGTNPRCKGKEATIARTAARTFKGTSKRDVIVGTKAKDRINSGRGNDLVCAKGGNDKVNGGAGKDKLFGQGGKDKLLGKGGNDKLVGGAKKDRLIGGPGKDKLLGKGGNDTCIGGPGRDTEKSC